MTTDHQSSLSHMHEIVSSYPKVRDLLAKEPEKLSEILEIIEEIDGNPSKRLLDVSLMVIDHGLKKLYDSVEFEVPEGFDLTRLQERYHLALVPNHQSHADYIAISYLWYKNFSQPLHVAGGINLNIFLVGNYFRATGAFFIRRSFQGDQLYKITFEAYIYYLLKTNRTVEFFFEGGRSRSGKLLPPKFGLFQMLLEAHEQLADGKPLMFIPVSIAHEHIPEQNSYLRELMGEKKRSESLWGLLSSLNVFNKKMGRMSVTLGEGIVAPKVTQIKNNTQELAFKCFVEVGSNLSVSAVSLLAMMMLDGPSGARSWNDMMRMAQEIHAYCLRFSIPLAPTLRRPQQLEAELRRALDLLIYHDTIETIWKPKLSSKFYAIKPQCRVQLIYFKNMIIHHFLVPSIINAAWFNLFNGTIKSMEQFHLFLVEKRKELRFDFYLPPATTMLREALEIISFSLGRSVTNLGQCFALSAHELSLIAYKVSPFASALTSVYESYYVAASTLAALAKGNGFSEREFLDFAKEIHEMELIYGRIVKYPESYLTQVLKGALNFYRHQQVLHFDELQRSYTVLDQSKVDFYIQKFAKDVQDQVVIQFGQHRPLYSIESTGEQLP